MCAERLTAGLLPTARQLARWEELAGISRATVQRLLQRFQQDTPKLPRRLPQQPVGRLREAPMKRLPWSSRAPGSFETDLAQHCGPVAAGEYVHTLQLVDIATGWSERAAVPRFYRGQAAMVEGFRQVQARLPFPIRHLHPDNGSEFFNDHLLRYFAEGSRFIGGEAVTGLKLSRSRP